MAEFHWQHAADITVAVQPVGRQDAPSLGILKRAADGRIIDFVEKPGLSRGFIKAFPSAARPGVNRGPRSRTAVRAYTPPQTVIAARSPATTSAILP